MKSAMKVPPGVAQSRKRVWLVLHFQPANSRFEQPWEEDCGKPERIVTALDIMTEGPLGGAAFNNEFGRPALKGYFRTYEEK
ncbi:hypothetical protein ACNKHR_20540 [Shigella flexneri]